MGVFSSNALLSLMDMWPQVIRLKLMCLPNETIDSSVHNYSDAINLPSKTSYPLVLISFPLIKMRERVSIVTSSFSMSLYSSLVSSACKSLSISFVS